MILADKIILLRKRKGWSQEELAEQLGVTRQSVSKWEGAQSVPDIQKIIQMSEIFGVTTDYLLKDEIEDTKTEDKEVINRKESEDNPEELRVLTMNEASEYLRLRREAAPKMAGATLLCVLSPIALLMLSALSERPEFSLSENMAAGIGLCVLLLLVTIAVVEFMSCYHKVKQYDYLENEAIQLETGATEMVKKQKEEFRPAYSRMNITGVVLCILSVLPLFMSVCVEGPDILYVGMVSLLLIIVGLGCYAFVYAGTIQNAMDKLLEEGDYSRKSKEEKSVRGTVSVVYWLIVTAIFLYYTFGPQGNGQPQYSWFIWAVAGILYSALMTVWTLLEKRNNIENSVEILWILSQSRRLPLQVMSNKNLSQWVNLRLR